MVAPTSRRAFLSGMRAQLPLLLGVVPFGLIFGALAVSEGIPPWEAQALSLFVFAGSAQFIAVGLIAGGAPPAMVVLTILIVNLRHLLYSAAMARRWQSLPNRWKAALAWLLTDEAFAIGSLEYAHPKSGSPHAFYLGTGLALWLSWQTSTAAGILLGALSPASWGLEFALPLTFLAMLFPLLEDRCHVVAAVVAGVLSPLLAELPYGLGLLMAILAGIAAAMGIESQSVRRGAT